MQGLLGQLLTKTEAMVQALAATEQEYRTSAETTQAAASAKGAEAKSTAGTAASEEAEAARLVTIAE